MSRKLGFHGWACRSAEPAPSVATRSHRLLLGAFALAIASVSLAACGSPTSPTVAPAETSQAPRGTPSTIVQNPGIIQGIDNNGNPYGDFKVTVKVAPHLENVDFGGNPYSPSIPVQADGTCSGGVGQPFCDPAGYQFIHFTLTFTNPTTAPEAFGSVGFTPAERPLVFLAASSSDGGTTPASSAFGGPTNGLEPITQQDRDIYWEADRGGPGDLLGFPESFATSHFMFTVDPTTESLCENTMGITAACPPDTLSPGQGHDVEYASFAVAPTAPIGDLTLWAGVHPQQLHG